MEMDVGVEEEASMKKEVKGLSWVSRLPMCAHFKDPFNLAHSYKKHWAAKQWHAEHDPRPTAEASLLLTLTSRTSQ